MSHPHNRNIFAAHRSFRARALNQARSLWTSSLAALAITLMASAVFLSGCAVGSFELTRPDGVTVRASAMALFRDTGLEGFNYTVDESSRGGGLLPAVESRAATVGAQGYRGSTNIDAVIELLKAVK